MKSGTFERIGHLLKRPSEHEIQHAARLLFALVGFTCAAILGPNVLWVLIRDPLDNWGPTSARSEFATLMSLRIAIQAAFVGAAMLVGWSLGGIVDWQISDSSRRALYYCTQILFAVVGALGIVWSVHGILGGELPMGVYVISGLAFLLLLIRSVLPLRDMLSVFGRQA
jgi:hypothetical protein